MDNDADAMMESGLSLNMRNYKRALDRITKKYTGLSHEEEVELDLNKTSFKVLCRHLHRGQLNLNMEPNNSVDFGEQSMEAQDTSDNQQWDNTLQEREAGETGSNHSAQHEGLSVMNDTQPSQSFLDDTQESQPEDQDEELENTLSSHGTSLVELYPGMIDQLSKAWHSQTVFEAADSVLRKYRRQRCPPNRGHLNHTLDVSVRAPDLRNPKKNKGKVVRKRSSLLMNLTPEKTTEAVNQSYLHDVTNQQYQQTEIVCSTKNADPVKSYKYRPAVLLEPSFVNKLLQKEQRPEPTESPHQRDQPTGRTSSPIRSGHLTIDGFENQSPRSGREALRPLLTCSTVHEKESLTVADGSAVCSSPVRQLPFKTWLRNLERQSGESHALSQSPKSDTAARHSRHLGESTSRSASPRSSPQNYSTHLGESRSASTHSSPQKYSTHLGESRSASTHSSPQKYSRHLGESWSASPLSAPSPQKYSRHLRESRSASPFSSPQKYSRHLGESTSRSASPLSSPQKSIMSPRKHRHYSPSQPKVKTRQSPSRIHKSDTAQSPCRHPAFTRSRSESPHSSLQKLTMSPRKHQHCSDSPSQSKIYSRQSTTGTGRSFDVSTCHYSSIPHSPKKIDVEFQRVYHKLVCLAAPGPFAVPPCSVCARHMEANRALSALALSPHRSHLRKRHRELDSESPRSNKRSRDRCDVNSPGSLRHLGENLKPSSSRRLYSTGPEASSYYQ